MKVYVPHRSTPELEEVIKQVNFWIEELDRRLRVEESKVVSSSVVSGLALSLLSPSSVNAGDTASLGSDTKVSKGDHRHSVNTAGDSDVVSTGVANSGGNSSKIPRANHIHMIADHDHQASGSGRGGQIDHGLALSNVLPNQHHAQSHGAIDHITLSEIKLQELAVAPGAPVDGWVVYADGAGWNPGAGEGVYARIAGAWVKL